jgi:3-hydroxy-9,10-secoandrosta-1,3,5(10)-triene-9,17-dione monooxygenase reductase component
MAGAAFLPDLAAVPDPEIDPGRFREVLGRFATGVTLITARVDGAPHALVANSFSSVSLRPPLVSFCPSRASLTWRKMRSARRFGVNILGEQHEAFVERAAAPGADRFAGLGYELTAGGVPAITDAVAFLECVIEDEHPAGDHWIVVGRVQGLELHRDRDPLVFWASSFGAFAPRGGGVR